MRVISHISMSAIGCLTRRFVSFRSFRLYSYQIWSHVLLFLSRSRGTTTNILRRYALLSNVELHFDPIEASVLSIFPSSLDRFVVIHEDCVLASTPYPGYPQSFILAFRILNRNMLMCLSIMFNMYFPTVCVFLINGSRSKPMEDDRSTNYRW